MELTYGFIILIISSCVSGENTGKSHFKVTNIQEKDVNQLYKEALAAHTLAMKQWMHGNGQNTHGEVSSYTSYKPMRDHSVQQTRQTNHVSYNQPNNIEENYGMNYDSNMEDEYPTENVEEVLEEEPEEEEKVEYTYEDALEYKARQAAETATLVSILIIIIGTTFSDMFRRFTGKRRSVSEIEEFIPGMIPSSVMESLSMLHLSLKKFGVNEEQCELMTVCEISKRTRKNQFISNFLDATGASYIFNLPRYNTAVEKSKSPRSCETEFNQCNLWQIFPFAKWWSD